MKIIKHGDVDEFPKTISCTGCASVLEVDVSDLGLYTFRGKKDFAIRCPICTEFVIVEVSKAFMATMRV